MSRSFRTDKDSRRAARRAARDGVGSPVGPRVVARRPRHGDFHPVPPRFLRNLLARVPLDYWHGLVAIELRARPADVGSPFAFYRPREKTIVLYSVPPRWTFPRIPLSLRRSLERFYATITEDGAGCHITWRSRAVCGLWFYSYVLAHELGHHKRFHYRRRAGRSGRRVDEEAVADLHAQRLTEQLFQEMRARRRARGSAPPPA